MESKGEEDSELLEELTSRIDEEIWEELLPIELGAVFEGTDIRKMAKTIGFDELYNLVYAPTSSEVHGEWASLKDYYLVRCNNPLHRFHRVPQLEPENILIPGIVLTASSLLADTVRAWLKAYSLESEFMQYVDSFTREMIPSAMQRTE